MPACIRTAGLKMSAEIRDLALLSDPGDKSPKTCIFLAHSPARLRSGSALSQTKPKPSAPPNQIEPRTPIPRPAGAASPMPPASHALQIPIRKSACPSAPSERSFDAANPACP